MYEITGPAVHSCRPCSFDRVFLAPSTKDSCITRISKWLFVMACVHAVLLLGCSSMKSNDLGCREGRLSPCPNSPNCVSSQSSDKPHYIAPLEYSGSLMEAKQALLSILHEQARCEIEGTSDRYIYATFTSTFFRFVDDVEFCFDRNSKKIHVRSQSRIGYFDFGVNRRRIEHIRKRFVQTTRSDSL